jgi:uncharacterized Zn finger protein
MYEVKVTVAPLAPARWSAVCDDCSGAIDSIVELLQGRLSHGVMSRLCDQRSGLFPSPRDILFTCSCPDWASMCKHVAAVLYGIGARLDQQPELLFTLREVDQRDLIAKAGAGFSNTRPRAVTAKVLEGDDLGELFGIDMAPTPEPKRSVVRATTGSTAKKSSSAPAAGGSAKPKHRAATRPAGKRLLTAAKRKAISIRMKAYWAARMASRKKR